MCDKQRLSSPARPPGDPTPPPHLGPTRAASLPPTQASRRPFVPLLPQKPLIYPSASVTLALVLASLRPGPWQTDLPTALPQRTPPGTLPPTFALPARGGPKCLCGPDTSSQLCTVRGHNSRFAAQPL